MSGNVRNALPDVREALSDVQERSRGPPGCPRVVGGDTEFPGLVGRRTGYPGVVERLSRMSGSGWVALPDVREWSGDPAECLGGLADVW